MATHGGLCYAQAMEAARADIDIVRDLMYDIDRTLLRENLKLTPEQREALGNPLGRESSSPGLFRHCRSPGGRE